MKKIKHLRFLGLLSVLGLSVALGSIPTPSFAQKPSKTTPVKNKKIPDNLKNDANKVEWRLHKSITGVFDAKFPQQYKYKIFPFQFNKNTFASSAEIISSLDGKVGAKREKSVLMKVTQTFGSELTYKEMKKTLERATQRYLFSAKKMDGIVLTNKDIDHNGFFEGYSIHPYAVGIFSFVVMPSYNVSVLKKSSER